MNTALFARTPLIGRLSVAMTTFALLTACGKSVPPAGAPDGNSGATGDLTASADAASDTADLDDGGDTPPSGNLDASAIADVPPDAGSADSVDAKQAKDATGVDAKVDGGPNCALPQTEGCPCVASKPSGMECCVTASDGLWCDYAFGMSGAMVYKRANDCCRDPNPARKCPYDPKNLTPWCNGKVP